MEMCGAFKQTDWPIRDSTHQAADDLKPLQTMDTTQRESNRIFNRLCSAIRFWLDNYFMVDNT